MQRLLDGHHDLLVRVLSEAGARLWFALSCQAMRAARRDLPTCLRMTEWSESQTALRWSLKALSDMRLILANVTDWDMLAERLCTHHNRRVKAINVQVDRCTLGDQSVTQLALAMKWNQWDGRYYGLGSQAAQALARILQSGCCAALRELDLAGCNMHALNLPPIADALSVSTLTVLDLDSNSLEESSAALLAAALPRCTRLRTLSLADNALRPKGVLLLGAAMPSCRELCNLNLDSNGLGDEGCIYVAGALPRCASLEVLGLADNGIAYAQGADMPRSGYEALAQTISAAPRLRRR